MKNIISTAVVYCLTLSLSAQDLKPFKSDKEKWGYKDESGKEIVPAKYDKTWDFNEGLAMVKNKKNKYGYIDGTGKEIISLQYDDASSFSEGLAKVKIKDKYGFIDKTGKEITPMKYDEVGNFSEGFARFRTGSTRDKKYGTLKGGKWGFLDKAGNEILAPKYDYAGNFSEGLAYVELNNKYRFIDTKGNKITLFEYDMADDFSEGMARVRVGGYFDGKWGFIDKTGKEVIPARFEEAGNFYKGEANVKLNGISIYIDKTGTNEEERKKIAKEEAERIEKERQANIDMILALSKRDTLSREILNLYIAQDNKLFDKVVALQRDVEGTMALNIKNGFDKRNWITMAPIIEEKVKIAHEQIEAYKGLLSKYENIKDKNELYNRINETLEKTSEFVGSCNGWASYIITLGAYSNGQKELFAVTDSLTALKKVDDALRAFIKLYKKRNGLKF